MENSETPVRMHRQRTKGWRIQGASRMGVAERTSERRDAGQGSCGRLMPDTPARALTTVRTSPHVPPRGTILLQKDRVSWRC